MKIILPSNPKLRGEQSIFLENNNAGDAVPNSSTKKLSKKLIASTSFFAFSIPHRVDHLGISTDSTIPSLMYLEIPDVPLYSPVIPFIESPSRYFCDAHSFVPYHKSQDVSLLFSNPVTESTHYLS